MPVGITGGVSLKGRLKFSSLEMFDWVVIGGASRSSQTPEFWPPFEWVVDLYQQARAAGCKVWFKPNAVSGLTAFPREIHLYLG